MLYNVGIRISEIQLRQLREQDISDVYMYRVVMRLDSIIKVSVSS